MNNDARIAILGASGYSGAELIRLLLRHQGVHIEKLFASASAGKPVVEVLPRFAGTIRHSFEPYSLEAACSSDVVFLALPSGEAMKMVPELLERGKKVIDLGGDFRLNDAAVYERYYKHHHVSPHLLPEAVYGLTEWNRENIKKAQLVANPGCYPTSALIPLIPLLKEKIIKPEHIIINSLSGVSGAGRSAAVELSFAEVNESVKAYKVGVHQHIPEISSMLQRFGGQEASIAFVPHLLPITRGIYTTIFATTENGISEDLITSAFQQYYGNEPFIRFSETAIPEIRNVQGTNMTEIGYRLDAEHHRLVLFSAIDNLLKGAAGQALQNMNLMLGFSEKEGFS